MTKQELGQWGQRYHYPQLVLSPTDIVRHGESSWQVLLKGSKKRWEKAIERVQIWEKRLEQATC